ncbi:LamG-like jellyroll fold domain-containing protein [Aquiflexum sp.]|uniref:LamG-like jellyroll fold domain-containing protein n=1 Tax=Aquiflexum sp. TaxID=1872584 RepID=UPI003594812A
MLTFNKPSSWRIYCIFIFIVFLSIPLKAQNYPVSDYDPNLQQVIAFPGAEGFGKYATGGRGGQVIKVTNLNDSGPGSFREAVGSVGPRIVVFEVSGTIELKSQINIRSSNSHLTVAGQTAPGDGITLKNYPLVIRSANNIIIRYIRSRMGDLQKFTGNAFNIRQDSNQSIPENIIIDHCSFSWGTDETMSIVNSRNITIQNSIISEGLNASIHEKGEHGYGGIISGQNISVYNNLISHFVERNFLFHTGSSFQRAESLIDFRNNVVYNWFHRASDGGTDSNINLFNNYYKAGPASFEGGTPDYIMNPLGDPDTYGLFYLEGNKLQHRPEVEKDQWSGVRLQSGDLTDKYMHLTQNRDKNGKLIPFPIPEGIYSEYRTATQAYQSVTDFAGASLVRDGVDIRIVKETRNGTNTYKGSKTGLLGIIDSQKDVGGWPVLKSLSAPVDSDGDGIPDSWENTNNLDPKSLNDKDHNLSPYYTNIEVYINSLVQDILVQQNQGAPNQAELVLPANNESISPVDLSFAWKPLNNASEYRIQISKNSDFSSNVININNIKTYSLVYPELDANSTYYWRVRASNGFGNGAYSTVRLFKTGSKNISPARTLLLSPENQKNNVGLSPVFHWAKVPNTDSYQIQVSGTSDFSNLIVNQSNITENVYQSPQLKENSTHYWRVRARNENGTGSYSTVSSFKTLNFSDSPESVVPVSPINQIQISPLKVNVKWLTQETAENYQVQIATDFSFSNLVFNKSRLTGTQLEIPNLDPNKTYYWRIRGVNRSGTGRYSATNQFKTLALDAPQELPDTEKDINTLLNNGLIGYWPMDEGSGNRMMDQSGKGNHATIVNANGVTWKAGMVNKAISLSGHSDRFGRASHNSSLAIPKAVTIAAWVKPSVMGRNSIISKSDSNGNGFELWLDLNGQIVFRLNRGKDGSTYRLLSNFNYSNLVGKWFHIAATFDGNYHKIYINGEEDISRTYFNSFEIGTNSGVLVIGAIGTIQRFKGEMDELRLYERAFSDVEIPLLLRVQSPPPPQSQMSSGNLVGHWKMDEGSGNKLLDDSGNGNDANIIRTSGVTWITGVEGLALNLDGGTGRYGEVAHNSSLEIKDAISIAAWVNPNVVGRNTVISKSDGNVFELTLNNDGIIDFYLNRGSADSYRLRSKYNYTRDIGNWIHVTATFDGSNSKIYINGIEDVSGSSSPFTIGTFSGDLSIAANGTIQRFKGSLDDLRLYSGVLSVNEIEDLASNSKTMRILQRGSKTNTAIPKEDSFQSEASIVPENREERIAPVLYPNPAESWIQVMSLWQKDGTMKGQVYDMKGVLLMEKEFEVHSFSIEIDLSPMNLKTGNYMLILQDTQHREVFRFIKK